ncbi:(E)-4-hydroxy-3-methylbut-2-enyl-diphosphate synthase [Parelusimicrobium proximum]|uniref:flavodoxin-dependent (E)-4-hydroxy-3-methylbut-2-enyl-diphosphate synthase n=1 Tax=Parelusimicrobium proximum TaxID=3228953 RepID=UPI003D180520
MRKTREVHVGKYILGGGHPVRVQSMCNTDTRDTDATIQQIKKLEDAGCEINRVAVLDMQAAESLGKIKQAISSPLVADIHFDHRLALEAIRQGVDKVRINPGNIGSLDKVSEVVKACRDNGVAIRIGVNAGSLKNLNNLKGASAEKWAGVMVEEAFENINILEKLNFKNVLVSLKADDLKRTILANEIFVTKTDIPLHIGLTEAGSFLSGAVKSAMALGGLLEKGIGDTIRVSLTEDPALQVRCAYEILKALSLREYGPDLVSCPTCGRCRVNLAGVVRELERRIYSDKELIEKSTGLKIAVMGCAVNGPGEAKEADFGLAGGIGEGILFEKGEIVAKVPEPAWVDTIISKIREH